MSRLLTIAEACRVSGVSRSTMDGMVMRHRIPTDNSTGKVRVDPNVLLTFCQEYEAAHVLSRKMAMLPFKTVRKNLKDMDLI